LFTRVSGMEVHCRFLGKGDYGGISATGRVSGRNPSPAFPEVTVHLQVFSTHNFVNWTFKYSQFFCRKLGGISVTSPYLLHIQAVLTWRDVRNQTKILISICPDHATKQRSDWLRAELPRGRS
jgi:hypothetical protein